MIVWSLELAWNSKEVTERGVECCSGDGDGAVVVVPKWRVARR